MVLYEILKSRNTKLLLQRTEESEQATSVQKAVNGLAISCFSAQLLKIVAFEFAFFVCNSEYISARSFSKNINPLFRTLYIVAMAIFTIS